MNRLTQWAPLWVWIAGGAIVVGLVVAFATERPPSTPIAHRDRERPAPAATPNDASIPQQRFDFQAGFDRPEVNLGTVSLLTIRFENLSNESFTLSAQPTNWSSDLSIARWWEEGDMKHLHDASAPAASTFEKLQLDLSPGEKRSIKMTVQAQKTGQYGIHFVALRNGERVSDGMGGDVGLVAVLNVKRPE